MCFASGMDVQRYKLVLAREWYRELIQPCVGPD